MENRGGRGVWVSYEYADGANYRLGAAKNELCSDSPMHSNLMGTIEQLNGNTLPDINSRAPQVLNVPHGASCMSMWASR